MVNLSSKSATVVLGISILSLAGCGVAAEDDGAVHEGLTSLVQPIKTTSSNHAFQSETSIAVGKTSGGGQTIAVGYNDATDPLHITFPTIMTTSTTAGASLMG